LKGPSIYNTFFDYPGLRFTAIFFIRYAYLLTHLRFDDEATRNTRKELDPFAPAR